MEMSFLEIRLQYIWRAEKSSVLAIIGWIVRFVMVYNLKLCALTRQLVDSGLVRDSWQFQAWKRRYSALIGLDMDVLSGESIHSLTKRVVC
ncbi:unnamed protein product [Camellia sinensis]